MKMHHIGIAVADIKKSKEMYEYLGYCCEREEIIDINRNLRILFMINNGHRIELLQSYDASKQSPIDNFIDSMNKQLIYHTCYEVDNIEKTIFELESQKYVVIDPLEEAPALDDRRVCFLINRNVGIIELLEMRNN